MDRSGPSNIEENDIIETRRDADSLIEEMGTALGDGHVPISIYNDETIYSEEVKRIFGNAWVFVGHESEIPSPGDYRLRTIGEDTFIFVRGEDEHVRVLFDSCRHRGSQLCRADKGNTSHFRCPYHGWTYKNTGELIGVPHLDAFDGIAPAEKSLVEPPNVDSYAGLVFASLDPDAESLRDYLGGFTWYLDLVFKLTEWEVTGDPQRWEVDVNWKIPPENVGDNYHVQIAHKSALDTEMGSTALRGAESSPLSVVCNGHDMSIIRVENDDSVFWGQPEESISPRDFDDEQLEMARHGGTMVGCIFPNFTFIANEITNDPNKDPVGSLCLRQHQPRGPGRMEYMVWVLAPRDVDEARRERIYDALMGTFGASGSFVSDDIAVWQGITEAAGSEFAGNMNLTNTYTMGRDGSSESRVVQDFPGPGTVLERPENSDINQINFHESWYNMMTIGKLGRDAFSSRYV